eukprot:6144668-Pleurochrysis_carterae.AAC.2
MFAPERFLLLSLLGLASVVPYRVIRCSYFQHTPRIGCFFPQAVANESGASFISVKGALENQLFAAPAFAWEQMPFSAGFVAGLPAQCRWRAS